MVEPILKILFDNKKTILHRCVIFALVVVVLFILNYWLQFSYNLKTQNQLSHIRTIQEIKKMNPPEWTLIYIEKIEEDIVSSNVKISTENLKFFKFDYLMEYLKKWPVLNWVYDFVNLVTINILWICTLMFMLKDREKNPLKSTITIMVVIMILWTYLILFLHSLFGTWNIMWNITYNVLFLVIIYSFLPKEVNS